MLWHGYSWKSAKYCNIFVENLFSATFFSREVLLPPLSTPENAPLQEPKGGGGGLNWTLPTHRRYWAKWTKFHVSIDLYHCMWVELYHIEPYWTHMIKTNFSAFSGSFNSKKLNSDTSRLWCLLQTFSCFVLWMQAECQWAKLTVTKNPVKIHVESQQFLWECRPLFLWSSPQSPAFDRLSPLPSSLLDTLWGLFGYVWLYISVNCTKMIKQKLS